MFLRVERGFGAVEHATDVDHVLCHAVDYAFAFGDGFRLCLVGHVEDVDQRFDPDFQASRHDSLGDLGVAYRAGDLRFGGVVAFLLRQDVVVRFDVEDDVCHTFSVYMVDTSDNFRFSTQGK